ncbi:single-strand DNA endonuclease ASTE1-like [Paramisgurnus dabryanus]|uniref:single-strand DNA endonuclease ASTE1-like n=1 Tax=Paramisgurnus dabryanus TaxID=90735 RepID=UPI0031F37E20
MGVQELKSFIGNNTGILRNLSFRDSKLIIDGCNLYHNLYLYFKLDQIHGGEYEAFEDLLTQFFTNLRHCDIQPYVVIDGGADHTDKALETLKARKKDKIKRANELFKGREGTCFPLLIKNVFIQTVHKLKVPFVQCVEEADWEIAALANQWDCPVLSNNRDFYIFNIKRGILPTGKFWWRNVKVNRGTNKKYILTKHFTVERLCASFNHMNKDLLAIFACILGNDYMNLQKIIHLRWEAYSVRSGDFSHIDGLLTWLSKFPGPEAAIDGVLKLMTDNEEKVTVREALFKGIKEYKLTKGSLAQYFLSKTPATCTGPLRALPTWTLKHLHEGKIGSFIVDILALKRVMLNPQVEDFQQPSSNETSRPIRQVVYGLVLLGELQTEDKLVAAAKASTGTDKCYVTEYDRQGLTLTSSEVEAIETKVKEGLRLETLWKEPHPLRLQILLETLDVSSVRGIPLHLQLQVFATRYWLVNAKPQPNLLHLWGLLLGMVYGRLNTLARTQIDRQLKRKGRGKIYLDHEVAYLYSQWQSCLRWSLCLNQLLCRPLPEPECARLYFGTLVHQAVREFERGITPESLLATCSKAEKLFGQLRNAVLSLLDEDVVSRISTGHMSKAFDKTQSDKCMNQSEDELSSCFEHLMNEDNDDYDEVTGKKRKGKDHKTNTLECSTIRTRHKAKARNAKHPSKKSERRCFD